jgi:hypothetical protein
MRLKKFAQFNFLSLLLVAFLNSCNHKDCCTIIDTDVQIHYQNGSGENLINSNDELSELNIKVYYKNQDGYEYIYYSNLDFPNIHRLDEGENGELILTVFSSNYYYDDNFSTTLIEIGELVPDTLVCEYQLSSNQEVIINAWVNGIEMNNRFLKIVK